MKVLGITDSTPNDGSYTWTVSMSIPSAINYSIRVKTIIDNLVWDDSGEITIED